MSEARPDAILEIASDFAERLLRRDCANEAYAEHKTHYVHLFMGGYPGDGFHQSYAMAEVERLRRLIAPLGWFVAKTAFNQHEADDADEHPDEEPQTMCFVDLFPMLGEATVPGPVLWHVAPRSARDGILAKGLLPSFGGSDFIITENARVYAARDEDAAHRFADEMHRLRDDWDEWDLWRIDAARMPDADWRVDVEAPVSGLWTTSPVPTAAIAPA